MSIDTLNFSLRLTQACASFGLLANKATAIKTPFNVFLPNDSTVLTILFL